MNPRQPPATPRSAPTTTRSISPQRLLVQTFPVDVMRWGRRFRENIQLLADPATGDAVIIDPGLESPALEAAIARRNLKIRAILNTHGHFDHIEANDHDRRRYKVKVHAHRADRHFYGKTKAPNKPDVLWDAEGELTFGSLKIRVLHVPGHSRGSVFFLARDLLFSGDTLFLENVGMTHGDGRATSGQMMRLQLEGIRKKILTLPPSVRVFPGHGPPTDIGHEKAHNPRLTGKRRRARPVTY